MAKHDREKAERKTGKSREPSRRPGMESRGVSRPMAEMQHDHNNEEHVHHDMKMGDEQRREMLHMHHMQTLWIYWTIIILGAWMIASPLTFDYGANPVQPSGGRDVWLTLRDRIAWMKWSDIVSGILLVVFGWRALKPDRPVSMWICCFVGIWLTAAPIVFWAPTAAAYVNDTLVGAIVIALTILIPGMPNMIMYMKMGSEVPQGWSYNPSSWPQRWIMIVAGFAGWIVSRYLAAFQLGYISTVWDPFFGDSSRHVLNSEMSQSLPVSDAGLGALAYTFEFLMGFMGSPSRWRTMPWMVTFFGILVIPLGLVHIFLVISQPLVVGAWCTFCILAALIMLPMIPLEADEVIAMGQHMVQTRRKGESLWRVFWKGGTPVESNSDERTPALMQLPDSWKVVKASLWGMSCPATLLASTLLGVWIVASPAVFGLPIRSAPADVCHLAGSLVVVVSVIAMGEVLRAGRYLNVLLGLGVAVIPWFLPQGELIFNISASLAGVLVAGLAFPRGAKTERYGLWDKFVR